MSDGDWCPPETLDACRRMKQGLGLFPFLSEEEVEAIADHFVRREAAAGDSLWHEGDPCDCIAFILSGRIEVKKRTEFPGREVIVGIYGPGSIAGELCIIDGKPRAVTAEAVEPTTVATLSRADFDRLLEEHPQIGGHFLKGILLRISLRLRKSFDRLAEIF